jgi:hypothetical protein
MSTVTTKDKQMTRWPRDYNDPYTACGGSNGDTFA